MPARMAFAMLGSNGLAPVVSEDASTDARLCAAMSGANRFSAALPAAADGESAGKSARRASSDAADGTDGGGDETLALLDAPAKNSATFWVSQF